jgi:hypothetical protein
MIENKIQSLTKHREILILDRGNDAIYSAIEIVAKISNEKIILVPDQGGWISYLKYPPQLGFEVLKIKTNRGVIDLGDLEIKSKKASAILFSSFAGYYAEQPLKSISEICRKNDCLVIEDVCGSLGDKVLCDGNLSDIIVGSFGKWKVVEAKIGGFISFNDKKWKKYVTKKCTINETQRLEIALALRKNKLKKLLFRQNQVKTELSNLKIFHKDKRGVNVVVEKKPSVLIYCQENSLEIVECPKYIRVEEPAYSIELKRLPYESI